MSTVPGAKRARGTPAERRQLDAGEAALGTLEIVELRLVDVVSRASGTAPPSAASTMHAIIVRLQTEVAEDAAAGWGDVGHWKHLQIEMSPLNSGSSSNTIATMRNAATYPKRSQIGCLSQALLQSIMMHP